MACQSKKKLDLFPMREKPGSCYAPCFGLNGGFCLGVGQPAVRRVVTSLCQHEYTPQISVLGGRIYDGIKELGEAVLIKLN